MWGTESLIALCSASPHDHRHCGSLAPLRSAASPYQKAVATRAAERALRPWAPYGAGMGERDGAVLAQLGPAAALDVAAGPSLGGKSPGGSSPTALYEIAPEAAKAIGEAAGRVGLS